jgi:dihydropteroate synthase
MIWRAGTFCLELKARTLVMGIVNVTPDSFSGDGVLKRHSKEKIRGLAYALKLVEDGADILDVGGESSRPGAKRLAVEQETRRVIPLIAALVRRVNVPVSVDTYKPLVARRALEAGASIVNVIKGPCVHPRILRDVSSFGAGLVLMHMRGTSRTMQKQTTYRDVVGDVKAELKKALENCKRYGIKKENIAVDPGIGFAKTVEQNLILLRRLDEFLSLGYPVLVGTSRKSFIGKTLGLDVNDRLMGTAATVALGVAAGAAIVRVHDVKAMKQVVLMADAVVNGKEGMPA